MRPAARLAAAVALLEAFQADPARPPPDRLLTAWGRSARYAGAKDRAAVGDILHDLLRRRRSLAWEGGGESARAAAIGWTRAAGEAPEALFGDGPHAPAALDDAERAALAKPRPPAPDPVRLDYPDWLDARLRESLGPKFETAMTALQERAPLDLRVNRLKGTPEEAAGALAEEGIEAMPGPLSPDCLRARPGAPVVRSRAYAEGLVELQDAASQAAARFAGTLPGETVLDFCAGGGGKSLALAAAMEGRGRLVAHDVAPRRMKDLPARAERAGARLELTDRTALDALRGGCDLVFVDAPCSGSGAWRRDPAGKWRLSPETLGALIATQHAILDEAADYVRPGGRLAYATCSILMEENGVAAEFAAARGLPPPAALTLTPGEGGDGFHCSVMLL